MQHIYIIAITGGIGSGKSIVSRVLRAKGYPVYDCDSRARALMDNSAEIKIAIAERVCADAILADGLIDRGRLSEVVFADGRLLAELNAIVHRAVRRDLLQWADSQESRTDWLCPTAFVETAILYQSGLDQCVDAVWEVVAPEQLRIERVMRRNGISAEAVVARIRAQAFTPDSPHREVHTILNDDITAILPQVNALIKKINFT